MDYEFYSESGRPVAELSMEQSAIGVWLSLDVGTDANALDQILTNIQLLHQKEKQQAEWQTQRYRLLLTRTEVFLIANSLSRTKTQPSEPASLEHQVDTSFSDESFDDDIERTFGGDEGYGTAWEIDNSGQEAGCGLDDFEDLLCAWRDFIREPSVE